MTTGKKIKLARTRIGPRLTQEQLAHLLGVSRSIVAKYETDTQVPPPDILLPLAKRIGVSVSWFYDDFQQPLPFEYLNKEGDDESPKGYMVREMSYRSGSKSFPFVEQYPVPPLENAERFIEFSDALYDKKRKQFVVEIIGDSASPSLMHGDYVLVNEDPEFQHPGFLTVVHSKTLGYLVKVLVKTEDGTIMLRSLNKDYDDILLDSENEMVGLVIGWKREKGPYSYIEAGHRTGLKPGFLG